jgi:hypothetical protein
MANILTILTFPLPCMAIWRSCDVLFPLDCPLKNSRAKPLAFEIDSTLTPACEILLPNMWNALKPHHESIRHVATLSEPGPFTAQRAGSAFARGLVHGDDGWHFFTTSLFNLMPEGIRSDIFLDTGANHWVNSAGKIGTQPLNPEHSVSPKTCTSDMILTWSQQCAALAVSSSDV